MTAATAPLGREIRAISLIGFGHFLSHFYMLSLPPLFILIRDDLGVSFVQLGVILTVYNLATAVLQTPMGILVDRIGARRVLIGGLFVNALAVALSGWSSSYWELLVLYLLAGAGNSVFHPADYVILTASVDDRRQGRAYSIHSFGGSMGFAAAPATMLLLAARTDWRTALLVVGIIGMVLSLVFVFSGDTLREDARTRKTAPAGTPLRGLMTRAVILFFLFYILTSASSIGITAFAAVFLPTLYGMSLEAAGLALSVMLFGNAVGTLFGGPLADWTRRHDRVLVIAFSAYVVLIAAVGTGVLPVLLVYAAFALSGFGRGIVNPSRDLMVREAAPALALGTVFAFVSTGFSIGQGLAPLAYGALLDAGLASPVLYLSAALSLLAIGLLLFSRDRRL